jgi:hypothetical protein
MGTQFEETKPETFKHMITALMIMFGDSREAEFEHSSLVLSDKRDYHKMEDEAFNYAESWFAEHEALAAAAARDEQIALFERLRSAIEPSDFVKQSVAGSLVSSEKAKSIILVSKDHQAMIDAGLARLKEPNNAQ